MKKIAFLIGVAVYALTTADFAVAATSPVATKGLGAKVSCDELNRQYDFSSRQIAMIDADGASDDSAPRESNRQLKILNSKQDQLIVLEFMRMNGCSAPSNVNGYFSYSISALKCATEKLKGNYQADICDLSKWPATNDVGDK